MVRRCQVLNTTTMMTFTEFLLELRMRLASSNLKSIAYNKKTKILVVTFRSGSIYEYRNVEADLIEELKFAESRGRFFIQHIVRHPEKYPYRKIRSPRPGYKSTSAFNTGAKSVHQRHRLNTARKGQPPNGHP